MMPTLRFAIKGLDTPIQRVIATVHGQSFVVSLAGISAARVGSISRCLQCHSGRSLKVTDLVIYTALQKKGHLKLRMNPSCGKAGRESPRPQIYKKFPAPITNHPAKGDTCGKSDSF